jgi:hypothetical protein
VRNWRNWLIRKDLKISTTYCLLTVNTHAMIHLAVNSSRLVPDSYLAHGLFQAAVWIVIGLILLTSPRIPPGGPQ